MHRFVAVTADELAIPTCSLVCDIPSLERISGMNILHLSLPSRSWYRHRMLMGRVLMHADYEVLRANLADVAADAIHTQVEFIPMLKICRTQLPTIPALFNDYLPPPGVCVPGTPRRS